MSWAEYIQNPPFVGLLQFETSTTCNGACVFCHHKDMTRKGTASWSTILEVIDVCAPFATTVCPFLMQEPLLEPRLCTVLDNIKQVNFKANTQIYTNMAKLPQNWQSLIDEQNLDKMIISFYGPTRELYKKFQPAFDWAQTRRNIRRFMVYRKKQGLSKPEVTMHYIALPELMNHAESFAEEWSKVVDRVGTTVYRTHDEKDAVFNSYDEIAKFEQTVWGKPVPARIPCARIWSGFYVLFNGDVVPCSADYDGTNVLGNIHEEDPRKIWWGTKHQGFRKQHVEDEWDKIPLCKNCNYWKYEMSEQWVTYWLTSSRGHLLTTQKSLK